MVIADLGVDGDAFTELGIEAVAPKARNVVAPKTRNMARRRPSSRARDEGGHDCPRVVGASRDVVGRGAAERVLDDDHPGVDHAAPRRLVARER
ncbi:MAG: hypothetical protein ABI658_29300 [Acidimicrobiales bacterium]